jgi:hypothetical protein
MSLVSASLADHLLDPLAQCFTAAVAEEVLNLRFDKNVQVIIEDLRHKANEGTLSPAERDDYETLIETMDFIAILQAKSKRMLQDKTNGE